MAQVFEELSVDVVISWCLTVPHGPQCNSNLFQGESIRRRGSLWSGLEELLNLKIN